MASTVVANSSGSVEANSSSAEAKKERNMEENREILPGYQSVEQFSQDALQKIMVATKVCNELPSVGDEWEYYSSFSGFQAIMQAQGKKILSMMQVLLKHEGIGGNLMKKDLEEKFDTISDANDVILERVESALDEADGKKKEPDTVIIEGSKGTPTAISGSWNKSHMSRVDKSSMYRLLAGKNIERPQLKFKDKVDNSYKPFVPKLTDKPNSLKPMAVLPEFTEDGIEYYGHPYQYELDMFEPPKEQLLPAEALYPKDISYTPLIFVNKVQQLQELLKDLQKEREFAVDVEHHSYRTFQGITCLIQISTRNKDYIIDPLELRDKLECLNEVFTKKTIVKVFHGANKDMEWLQRDLGIYVVNMFDTYQAAKMLNFPQLSLGSLMKHYCHVDANKQFQMADWRIRPLPEAMIRYAREDTHYLLYIYDKLKNELLEHGNSSPHILLSVIKMSTEVCKTRYEKPVYHKTSHIAMYRKSKKSFNNRQMVVLKEIYAWRDKIAREMDESTGYVLPNHMLLHIAQILPREMQGILACCNPIPPLVRQNLNELHNIVYKARELPLVKFGEEDITPPVQSDLRTKENVNSLLHCPHDLAHQDDGRSDLPSLLDKDYLNKQKEMTVKSNEIQVTKKTESMISAFNVVSGINHQNEDVTSVAFLSPFKRFQIMKSVVRTANEPEESIPEIAKDPQIQKLVQHYRRVEENVRPSTSTAPSTSEVPLTPTINTKKRKARDEEAAYCTPLKKQLPKKKRGKKRTIEDFEKESSTLPQEHPPPEPVPHEPPPPGEEPAPEDKPQPLRPPKKPKFNAKRKKRNNKAKNSSEGATTFTPYDYSQVDYSKILGANRQQQSKYVPRHGGAPSEKRGKPRVPPRRSGRSLTYLHNGNKSGKR